MKNRQVLPFSLLLLKSYGSVSVLLMRRIEWVLFVTVCSKVQKFKEFKEFKEFKCSNPDSYQMFK
jgi:hypothetical protein